MPARLIPVSMPAVCFVAGALGCTNPAFQDEDEEPAYDTLKFKTPTSAKSSAFRIPKPTNPFKAPEPEADDIKQLVDSLEWPEFDN